MKKIDIPALGAEKQIWFNIGRLRRVEDLLKAPIGEVIKDASTISLKSLLVLLGVGMAQYGNKSEQYYAEKVDEALEQGYSIVDIQLPVFQAVVASGLMGKAAYYQAFPEELTEDAAKAVTEEKN